MYVLAIDLNVLEEPYFCFGVHNRRHIIEERDVIELTIGLIVINIVIEFYKKKE